MSDRYKGLTVVLEGPIKDEDAESIISAISMIKGVIKVVPEIHSGTDYIVRTQIKREIQEKLYEVVKE